MIRLTRTTQEEGPFFHAGRSVTLVTESWTLALRLPWMGLGATYRRPHSVKSEPVGAGPSATITWPIPDYVMLARIAGLLAMTVAFLWRRTR